MIFNPPKTNHPIKVLFTNLSLRNSFIKWVYSGVYSNYVVFKMVAGDPDLSFEIGDKAREWAAKVSGSNMLLFEVIERMRFFYPICPNFRGCIRELKFITYPGEGYVPNLPGTIFDTPTTFKLDIYMNLTTCNFDNQN